MELFSLGTWVFLDPSQHFSSRNPPCNCLLGRTNLENHHHSRLKERGENAWQYMSDGFLNIYMFSHMAFLECSVERGLISRVFHFAIHETSQVVTSLVNLRGGGLRDFLRWKLDESSSFHPIPKPWFSHTHLWCHGVLPPRRPWVFPCCGGWRLLWMVQLEQLRWL